MALYAQMCNGQSSLPFQLGISLPEGHFMMCRYQLIHLNTLIALLICLCNNLKQAVVRTYLMVIFVIFVLPSIALRHVSYWRYPQLSAACCIRAATDAGLGVES